MTVKEAVELYTGFTNIQVSPDGKEKIMLAVLSLQVITKDGKKHPLIRAESISFGLEEKITPEVLEAKKVVAKKTLEEVFRKTLKTLKAELCV